MVRKAFFIVVLATVAAQAAGHPLDFAEHKRPYTEVRAELKAWMGEQRWQAFKSAPAKAFAMRERWRGEDQEGFVKDGTPRKRKTYLSADERKKFEITIGADGRLYDAEGRRFGTGVSETMLVEDAETGKLYAHEFTDWGEASRFVHASYNGGKPTTLSAEVKVKDGVIKKIKNRSGHYRMDRLSFMKRLTDLEARGLDLSDANVEFDLKSALE